MLPGCENLLRAWPGGEAITNDLASARGFAVAHLERGADGIYYFNYMDSDTTLLGGPGTYHDFLAGGLAPGFLKTQPLRYMVSYRDTVPPGFDAEVRLPVSNAASFQMVAGPVEHADMFVRLGFASAVPADAKPLEVRVNGAVCVPAEPPVGGTLPGAKETRCFAIPEGMAKAGANHVEIGPETLPAQVVWVELTQLPKQ